jgi:hypothetical protein
MTVNVVKRSDTLEEGIDILMQAMVDDYSGFMPPVENRRIEMNARFKDGLSFTVGSKYIKVCTSNGGKVSSFIVKTENDKKFKKGDILKPAGWAAPARNAARGNILDGGYPINWTGPLYL